MLFRSKFYNPETGVSKPPTVAQQVLEAQGKQQELEAQGLEKLKGQAQSVEGQTLGEVAQTPEGQTPGGDAGQIVRSARGMEKYIQNQKALVDAVVDVFEKNPDIEKTPAMVDSVWKSVKGKTTRYLSEETKDLIQIGRAHV